MTLLAEEVFEVALLLLGPALPLVRAALSLLALVAREGTASFLHATLGPVHRPLVLVFPAAPAGHSVRSFPLIVLSYSIKLDEGKRGMDTLGFLFSGLRTEAPKNPGARP